MMSQKKEVCIRTVDGARVCGTPVRDVRRNPDAVSLYKQIRDGYHKILSVYGDQGCPVKAKALTEPLRAEDIRALGLNVDLLATALGAMKGSGDTWNLRAPEYLAFVYCLERFALGRYNETQDARLLIAANLCAWIRSCGQAQFPRGYLDGGGLSHMLEAARLYPSPKVAVPEGLREYIGNASWEQDPMPLVVLLHPFVFPLDPQQSQEAFSAGLRTWIAMWDWSVEGLLALGYNPLPMVDAPSTDSGRIIDHWAAGVYAKNSAVTAYFDSAAKSLSRITERDRRLGVWCAAQVARTVVHLAPDGKRKRPLRAIEAAEAWVRGEATIAEVQNAANNADAVTDANPAFDFAAAAAAAAANADAAAAANTAVYASNGGRVAFLADAYDAALRALVVVVADAILTFPQQSRALPAVKKPVAKAATKKASRTRKR